MRYYMDCEFIEDGKTIDVISIAIVAEDGRELYMQSVEFNVDRANAWVKEHVLTHLIVCPRANATVDSRYPYFNDMHYHWGYGQCTFADPAKGIVGAYAECPWRTREQIKREILHFMDIEQYGKPELWGYYSAYDHVAFCQIFGTMMDLPKGFPMYTRDIKQWCDALGNPKLPEQGKDEHNALSDAKWNRVAWEFLARLQGEE